MHHREVFPLVTNIPKNLLKHLLLFFLLVVESKQGAVSISIRVCSWDTDWSGQGCLALLQLAGGK